MITTMESTDTNKTQVQEWIHRWGSSTSEAIVDAQCQIFCAPNIDGFIGFRLEDDAAIVFGDPVCAAENVSALAEAFSAYCESNNLKIIYLIVSDAFAHWAIDHVCSVMIEVCEELVFNPQEDPTIGHKAHRLRNKVNHTHSLNLKVAEYKGNDPKKEAAMRNVGKLWLEGRKGPQIHLGPLELFADRTDKRWFYVEDEKNNIVAVALIRELEIHDGWFVKFLLTTPDAPRGTSELLMLSILETLRAEKCHYLSVGMVPAQSLGEIHGLGKIYKTLVRNFFFIAKWIFNLEHRKTYWKQFLPSSQRSFILFSKPKVGIKDVRVIMKALNVNM